MQFKKVTEIKRQDKARSHILPYLIPILLRDKALDRIFDKTRSMKETSINEQRTTHNYREYRRTKADA